MEASVGWYSSAMAHMRAGKLTAKAAAMQQVGGRWGKAEAGRLEEGWLCCCQSHAARTHPTIEEC